MSLLVTGSLGIDTLITPHGRADDVPGGTAVHFAFAASYFTDVRLVGVVGEDFPAGFRDLLASRNIDLRGLETRKGSKTFRWTGKYTPDMNDRETLSVELNVLGEAGPKVPPEFADSSVVFLANTHPALQRELRQSIRDPKLTVCDTMDLWIETQRKELISTLGLVDGIIVNDSEARQLTNKTDLISAGREMLSMGPWFVVIKKAEHGALLITAQGIWPMPSYPTDKVKDPTGAGDSFAGGMLGYLATQPAVDVQSLRRGMLRGTVAASFTVEDFSLNRVRNLSKEELQKRVSEFAEMLRVE